MGVKHVSRVCCTESDFKNKTFSVKILDLNLRKKQ